MIPAGNLADPQTLRAFLGRHGLRASKGLGQHFLCSEAVVSSIVEAAAFARGVLEIGPGPGVLTQRLSETSERMIALEVDDRMIEILPESAPRAEVRKVDALESDLLAILRELPEPRAVVSNLPYYITGPLLTRIAEAKAGYEIAVLMMQREVADRVRAVEKTSARGSLSVYLQSQFTVGHVAKVPPGAFMPPPKVDSSVLSLRPLAEGFDEPEYLRFVRLGFTQPRKTLANNLSVGLHKPREEVLAAIERAGLFPTVRPQEMSLSEWRALWNDVVA